jgi:5-methylcytosine-specific restriction enzyme subunit McrC
LPGWCSLLDAAGASGAAVFLVDMNKVFEEFVASRLRRYLHGRLVVHAQYRDQLDDAGSVRIRPDLVFGPAASTACYVADTKYKITADGFGRGADYYQLLAYTSALSLPAGLLIYCQHDGAVPPQQIHIRNIGTRLGTWALRLGGAPRDVEGQLHALADHIAAELPASAPSSPSTGPASASCDCASDKSRLCR